MILLRKRDVFITSYFLLCVHLVGITCIVIQNYIGIPNFKSMPLILEEYRPSETIFAIYTTFYTF